jgi:hypothetical protein
MTMTITFPFVFFLFLCFLFLKITASLCCDCYVSYLLFQEQLGEFTAQTLLHSARAGLGRLPLVFQEQFRNGFVRVSLLILGILLK